ncbi:hypothetical protein EGW08_016545 [Elysia chlorotica]|uniref:Uncharacterized protein n=1 Tax=Elysia chlorotica TaxID=188477 RepID=A0A3S0ZUQ0_ELYCH|nr:hypothetical protein EGW08_016545 [Elysia chlorotica]
MMMGCCAASNTVLAAVCVLVCFRTTYGYYGQSDSCMTEVKEQLEILTNEVSRLADARLPQKHNVTLDPVTLLSVERHPAPSRNTFTVNFTMNVPQIYWFVSSYTEETVLETEVQNADGHSSISLSCDPDECTLTISDTNQSSTMRLVLFGHGNEPLVQDEFTVPSLTIKHDSDLVYQPGSDVKVTIITPSKGMQETFPILRYSIKMIDENGSRFEEKSGSEWVQQIEETKYLRSKETTLRVKTSRHPVSGFLVLSLLHRDRLAPIVKDLEVTHSVVLKPKGQRGPFPDGFMFFPGLSRSQHTTEKMCEIETNCTLNCSAVGGFMKDLQIYRLLSNGEKQRVTNGSQ